MTILGSKHLQDERKLALRTQEELRAAQDLFCREGMSGVARVLNRNAVLEAELRNLELDARRYRYLRNRDLETIHMGGIFAGRVPENVVVNGDDLDAAIDWEMSPVDE
jgi:hypothetical protein